jgi:hypothetical protein
MILEIDIQNVAVVAVFEAKSQPPIAADRHREGPGSITVQGMKSTRPAQVARTSDGIERVEHQAYPLVKFGPNGAAPPGKKNLFDAFMREAPNRHRNNPQSTLDYPLLSLPTRHQIGYTQGLCQVPGGKSPYLMRAATRTSTNVPTTDPIMSRRRFACPMIVASLSMRCLMTMVGPDMRPQYRMRLLGWRRLRQGKLLGFAEVESPIGLKLYDVPVLRG